MKVVKRIDKETVNAMIIVTGLILLTAVLIQLFITSAQSVKNGLISIHEEGLSLAESGNYEEAIQVLSEIADWQNVDDEISALLPNSIRQRVERYTAEQNWEEALKAVSEMQNPQSFYITNRGYSVKIEISEEEKESLLAEYTQAYNNTRYNQALYEYEHKNYEQASQIFNELDTYEYSRIYYINCILHIKQNLEKEVEKYKSDLEIKYKNTGEISSIIEDTLQMMG